MHNNYQYFNNFCFKLNIKKFLNNFDKLFYFFNNLISFALVEDLFVYISSNN